MKLLAVTGYYKPAYVYGGPVLSESALFESLANFGVDVTVITTNANGGNHLDVPLLTPVDVNGVKVIYCPTKTIPGFDYFSPTQIETAKGYILESEIVNLQTFWGYASMPLSYYCVAHKIPYFVSLRGQLMDYAMKRTNWIKRLKKNLFLFSIGNKYLNGADFLHCTSPLEISHLEGHPIKSPTFLIPNSIDINDYKILPPRGMFRTKFNIPNEALVMILIGRLDPVKNPHIAVSALIASQIIATDVHLLVVGPDRNDIKTSLIEQANQGGCINKLHFTGLLDKKLLRNAMADSDLYIMPSESENFGMSAAECMAAGLPILVSDIVPVGSWAKEACAGETAAAEKDSFSNAAVALLKNPSRLKEMGNNGKSASVKLFDPKSVANEMYKQLERTILKNEG